MVHIMDKGFLGWGHHNNNQRKFTDILRQYQQQGEYKLTNLQTLLKLLGSPLNFFWPMSNGDSVLDDQLNQVGVQQNPLNFRRRLVNK